MKYPALNSLKPAYPSVEYRIEHRHPEKPRVKCGNFKQLPFKIQFR
jgi:hypothetical protein